LYTSIYRGFTDAARSCPALDLTAPVLAGWQPKWARAEEGLRAIDLWGNGQMNVAPYEFEEANRSVFDSVKGTFRKKEKTPTPASASSTFTGSPAMTGASPASSTHGSLGYSAHPAAHAATVPVDSKPPAYMSPAPQPAPPPPLPAPAAHPRPPVSYVRAIYAFSGEPTDLAFREGDKIELIQRTPDKDDWWTGRLNGRVGTFPGTYVEDI
ncbi:BAR adaptor protein Hob1, partial [Coemansia nantahalensis]